MSNEFCAPPQASLEMTTNTGPVFFTVSRIKLIVMSVLTFGLYFKYWNYKHWAVYQQYSGRQILPVARTIFHIFYTPSLFYKINGLLKAQGKGGIPYWRVMLIVYLVLAVYTMMSSLLVEMANHVYQVMRGSNFFEMSAGWYFLMIGLHFYILARVQYFINVLNDTPGGLGNSRFTLANFLWMLPGIGLILVYVVPYLFMALVFFVSIK